MNSLLITAWMRNLYINLPDTVLAHWHHVVCSVTPLQNIYFAEDGGEIDGFIIRSRHAPFFFIPILCGNFPDTHSGHSAEDTLFAGSGCGLETIRFLFAVSLGG